MVEVSKHLSPFFEKKQTKQQLKTNNQTKQKQNDQCLSCKVYRVSKQTYIRQLVNYICIHVSMQKQHKGDMNFQM